MLIEVASDRWTWGLGKEETRKIEDHLAAIRILKDAGLNGAGVIGAYHQRRVVPLMVRALPLHRMDLDAPRGGMVLSEDSIAPSEAAQRIKDAMDS
jgi:hypothetical protein